VRAWRRIATFCRKPLKCSLLIRSRFGHKPATLLRSPKLKVLPSVQQRGKPTRYWKSLSSRDVKIKSERYGGDRVMHFPKSPLKRYSRHVTLRESRTSTPILQPERPGIEAIAKCISSGNFLANAPPSPQNELQYSKFARLRNSTKDFHSASRDNSRRNGCFWNSRPPWFGC
jgi:hypothetical protein